ncbi:MAG: indole-3-glycerol phosphate synthase TrpC [Bacteroidales bacterium]|nr:indole-3-glycerol phosphate synthase TrpC [Bacteroidales bacterium]
MADILEEIVDNKRIEVDAAKQKLPFYELAKRVEQFLAENLLKPRSMHDTLMASKSGIIAEFKRKSPSKGWIHADAVPTDVVPLYEKNGASAASILVDEKYFGGSKHFIEMVRPMVSLPILYKEFIVDEYQLYEAKLAGADTVLLIAATLSAPMVKKLVETAHQLGLEILFEVHSVSELNKVVPETDILGVNNRHLGTFVTDVQWSFDIADKLSKDFLLVSESGISNPQTVRELRKCGYRGFLIGECFMKEQNPGEALKTFIQNIEQC